MCDCVGHVRKEWWRGLEKTKAALAITGGVIPNRWALSALTSNDFLKTSSYPMIRNNTSSFLFCLEVYWCLFLDVGSSINEISLLYPSRAELAWQPSPELSLSPLTWLMMQSLWDVLPPPRFGWSWPVGSEDAHRDTQIASASKVGSLGNPVIVVKQSWRLQQCQSPLAQPGSSGKCNRAGR